MKHGAAFNRKAGSDEMIASGVSNSKRFYEFKHGFAKLLRRHRRGGFGEKRTIACVWCRLHER